ncbi:MAG: fasciclin domain-containing protein [Brevundimonas sp.]|uniref:fasciclin domain-containing protein n=1 Tax=Brevundimonas sp. TaxID=1871086 RepID=UPI0027229AE8|nr:fasciclin domain-containing protein [Brevundimonas sp.]MDO9588621.1 fasciclin domain-containing protein [Brevundimonas sp.]MDP3658228.1 fasciclin domain-containing protein [Brevundimonas sp.]MDZ4108037.1 fasciclin domain-containing protein [Brevundimonas sp.]
MGSKMRWALAPLCVLALAGCGDGAGKADGTGAAAPSNRTIAATLKDDRAFGTLERVLDNAALGEVLAGTGPYTVFAPADAAFTASAGDLGDEAMKAQAAAMLRAHIVPGALTRADIEAAIAANPSRAVEMRTMANSLLTFSKEGETLIVAGDNGARARLTGSETLASNGVVQPVDALLVAPAPGG